jgi:hypothetical protein
MSVVTDQLGEWRHDMEEELTTSCAALGMLLRTVDKGYSRSSLDDAADHLDLLELLDPLDAVPEWVQVRGVNRLFRGVNRLFRGARMGARWEAHTVERSTYCREKHIERNHIAGPVVCYSHTQFIY